MVDIKLHRKLNIEQQEAHLKPILGWSGKISNHALLYIMVVYFIYEGTFVFWEIENVQFINNLYGIGMYGEQCSTTWSKTHLFVITGLKLLYFIIPCDCNFVEVLNKMISVLFMKYWTVSAVIRYVDFYLF